MSGVGSHPKTRLRAYPNTYGRTTAVSVTSRACLAVTDRARYALTISDAACHDVTTTDRARYALTTADETC